MRKPANPHKPASLHSSLVNSPVEIPVGTFEGQDEPYVGVIRSVYLGKDGTPTYTVHVLRKWYSHTGARLEEMKGDEFVMLAAGASVYLKLQSVLPPKV